jgi:hypothetical protein
MCIGGGGGLSRSCGGVVREAPHRTFENHAAVPATAPLAPQRSHGFDPGVILQAHARARAHAHAHLQVLKYINGC